MPVSVPGMANPNNWIQRYCQNGDQSAFRYFYRTQANRLWKFLIARGCDPDSAYDVLADAFLKFIQTVCKNPESPVALLYRIAINLNIDRYRRTQSSPVDSAADPEALEAARAEESDDHATVRTLLKSLPEGEQNLLLMRYWIGLSHRELAQALNLPEGTVRRQCSEALQKLRERWGQE